MAASQWPQNSDEFGEYFWKETGGTLNGKTIIRKINQKYTPSKMKVRLERYGPYIYGVIVNKPKVVIGGTTPGVNMKLMKIGFTHADTSQDGQNDNRIDTVKTAAENKLQKEWKLQPGEISVSVIFVLPIDALDTRCFFAVESEVREKCGIILPKEVGKKLHLPVHTEWVLTTDDFVKPLKKTIKTIQESNRVARRSHTNTPQIDQTHRSAAEGVDVHHTPGAVRDRGITPKSKQTLRSDTTAVDGVKARTPDAGGTTTPKSKETQGTRQQQPASTTKGKSAGATGGLEKLFESSLKLTVETIDTKSVFDGLDFKQSFRQSFSAVSAFLNEKEKIEIELRDDKKLHMHCMRLNEA